MKSATAMPTLEDNYKGVKIFVPGRVGNHRSAYIKGQQIGTNNTVSYLLGNGEIVEVTKFDNDAMNAFTEWFKAEGNYKRACEEWLLAHPNIPIKSNTPKKTKADVYPYAIKYIQKVEDHVAFLIVYEDGEKRVFRPEDYLKNSPLFAAFLTAPKSVLLDVTIEGSYIEWPQLDMQIEADDIYKNCKKSVFPIKAKREAI